MFPAPRLGTAAGKLASSLPASRLRILLAILFGLVPSLAVAVTVTIPASKDNTLYQLSSPTSYSSNGAGSYVFTGATKDEFSRRAVIHFDVAANVPAGATINSVTLQMRVSRAKNNTQRATTLHRLLADWGEGTSNADQQEGQGTTPTAGDATWAHRFYPGTFWTTPGGDFNATATATVLVGGSGFYTWSGAAVVAEVQSWLDGPAGNYGWLIKGVEGTPETAKRFDSSENGQAANRPALIVDYTPPAAATGACCTADTCQVVSAATCASLAGTYQGDGTSCLPDPCPPPPDPTGACCFGDGNCDTLTQEQCEAQAGTYQGDHTACTPDLCPLVLTPYVDALPRPAVATPVSGTPGGAAEYVMPIVEVSQQLHRDLPPTRVWGYAGSYPGPTIEASTGEPVQVSWLNDLRDSTGALRTTHYLPVDLCMHGPDSLGDTPRVVPHLHGGHVPHAVDGHPDSTFLPGAQKVYHYPNLQRAGTLWYHDHALGITRLNVWMGMAGFYLLRDATENALGLPAGEFEIALAIQDRSFNKDGTLSYPATWMDHHFGDVMLVNGKVWPYLQVKQGKYRFRLLNGCNSRVLNLSLSNAATFQVIGTEGGLLPAPVNRTSLRLTPGERADVVMDFAAYPAGTRIVLGNDAPAPYPGNPGEGVIPNVMRFDVVGTAGHVAPIPGALRPVPPIPTEAAVLSRDFRLRKMSDPCAGSMWTINDLGFDDVTEHPVLGTTEIWRFINDSGVSHPMHMHLVMFQVLDRTPFVRQGDSIVVVGPPVPAGPEEAGWKDTAPVGPNEILRVIARFEDYPGLFSYHCHILEHEDHEMMRQFLAVEPPALSIADALVAEGQSGTAAATFSVSLSEPVQSPVRVVVSTADGTASAATDYTAIAADTLVIPPLATGATVTVTVHGDGVVEPDETFLVRLSSPEVAVLGDSVATGTIVNDDDVPVVGVDDVQVTEGDAGTTDATFTVTLSAASAGEVRVVVATEDSSATAGADFAATGPDTLVFPAFSTQQSKAVPVAGDLMDEFDEVFRLRLLAALGAAVGDSVGRATILDQDPEPTLSVDDVALAEGNADTTLAGFFVTLSARSGKPVQVRFGTRNGTATSGSDYVGVAPPGTLTFAANDTLLSWAVMIRVLGDTEIEDHETFFADLSSPLNARLADSTATGTIQNDDGGVGVPPARVPLASYLGRGSPNPFSGHTRLEWGLSAPARVEIDVFDVQGRMVRRLAEGESPAGSWSVLWDGRDESGRAVPSGLYLVRMQAGERAWRTTVLRMK